MKQAALAIAAITLIGTPATAADMLVKAPVAPRVIPYSWSGFYIGANAGYGVARDPTTYGLVDNFLAVTTLELESFKMVPAGLLGGIQAGYNWQVSNWVFGLEADFQGTGQQDTACVNGCMFGPGPNFGSVVTQKLPWFGTVRGRLGVAAGPSLLYATGGLAFGRVDTTVTETDTFIPAFAGTAMANRSATQTGWTIGAGIEAALAGSWTAKVEYLYVDLGSQTIAFTDSFPVDTDTVTTRIRDNIVRAGLNYRFGGAPASSSSAMPLKAPALIEPGHNWTGVYAGMNLGYSAGNDPNTYTVSQGGAVFNAESYRISPEGVVGGGQIGANWQFDSWVAGIEADFQATSQSDSACVNECSPIIAVFGSTATVQQKLPWFGTMRGRFGVAVGPALFYATGGFAYGNAQTNVAQNVGAPGPVAVLTGASQINTGWAVGAGIEAAIYGNWSAKAEYLYLDLGSQNVSFFDPTGAQTTIATSIRDNIFRVGLNYKLDWAGPVAARY